ncbi:MAG: hypothetical protein M0P69_19190 [Bacteroidales bacterium]|nr:hypothetical protein [Bacteroidales bacterium]
MRDDQSRYYVRPSSIGSYFGVGWNTPEDQLKYDANKEEQEFDEASEDRMSLGRHLEDATLDYFADKLGVEIVERNRDLLDIYDGNIKGKFDGIIYTNDGKKILVENKISNAQSGPFTENPAYMFQIQSYLIDESLDKALLCGLWKGKPIFKWIERDEEMIVDIKRMVDWVTAALLGFDTFDTFPWDLYEKYSKSPKPATLEVDARGAEYLHKLGALNAAKSGIEKQIKDLKKEYEDVEFGTAGTFENDFVKVRVSEFVRKGSIDHHSLSLDHPEIDLDKYRDAETKVQTVRVTLK